MSTEFDPDETKLFIDIAREHSLLSEQNAKELLDFSLEKSVMSSTVAIERRLMKPMEVVITKALAAPSDVAPGYVLVALLGHGGVGAVFRAWQPQLRREVAIKVILDSNLSQQNVAKRLKIEAEAIGRLQHPNIVAAFDSGIHNNWVYLVMELIEGTDLLTKLSSESLSYTTALSILRQTARGLQYALSHRIIHRDIKPANLLLTEAEIGYDLPPGVPLVKIADFGLARLISGEQGDIDDSRLTLTGMTVGTPGYSAPEQMIGEEVDHRADIYALGSTLFFMLAGKRPYASMTVSRLIRAKMGGLPPRYELLPKDLDSRVRSLIVDMLKTDPEDRISSYEELIARIDTILGVNPDASSTFSNIGVPKLDPEVVWSKFRYLLFAATAALVLLVGWVAARQWKPIPTPSLVRNHYEEFLFDGETLKGWREIRGIWTATMDAEGGAILSGKGSLVHNLPMAGNLPQSPDDPSSYGFRVGVDLQKATSAAVHFGFEGTSFSDSTRIVLRFDGSEAQLGTKSNLQDDFIGLGERLEFDPSSGDSPQYHELRIEIHDGYWFTFFDGKNAGHIAVNQNANNQTIQLVATGDTAYFEGASNFQLIRP